MSQRLFDGTVRFEKVRGVGTMQVDFVPNQRAYVLIGENGIGKTKFLECLFTILFLTASSTRKGRTIPTEFLLFKKIDSVIGSHTFTEDYMNLGSDDFLKYQHNLPVVYVAAQNRGSMLGLNIPFNRMGNYQERSGKYLETLIAILATENGAKNFSSLNMTTDIKRWIIQRAQSANPYQAKEDNRKIELDVLLALLNKIDKRIDPEFLEISGDEDVFLQVEEKKTELSHLSSGFTSILKIVQAIVSGYGYFTNEVNIQNVRGVVLIDEIESHLHNEWQVKIIPLLKTLFPNTTFFITTHSSLVISQLEQGEVYRLQRGEDGVVYGKLVDYPSNASLVDLLDEAFGVDLNQQKIERAAARDQKEARQALLQLVQQELSRMETES